MFGIFSVSAQDSAAAKATNYISGQHYEEINPAYETGNKEQVVVYEFFGYKCPHCAHFQPFVKPWHKKLPKHVKFVRIPVVFQRGWDILAKAYYTAEAMGIAEKTHQAMFDALHKEHKRFNTMEDIADWYASEFSVDKDAFLSTANSFMIDSKIRQSNSLMQKMKVTSTPTLIINGKYKPNVKVLGNNAAVMSLTSYLTEQESIRMGLIK
jgi:thiol:disulfide interchange protein DsbA